MGEDRSGRPLRILHAIHDFVPRHRAGSEIYAFELCRELAARHHVTVLCAEYDPSRRHGHVTWRVEQGLPVVELVNNWVCRSFEDTYRPPLVGSRIGSVLQAVQPDVLHVHNLLNLSFDLPAMAQARGVAVVATLHDYALVCPSGGQRIHRAEEHVCEVIDAGRCARCFRESPFHAQISFGKLAAAPAASRLLHRFVATAVKRLPKTTRPLVMAARQLPAVAVTPRSIEDRLAAARRVFDDIDLFVAPSASIAGEFERLGLPPQKITVSDYGFAPIAGLPADGRNGGRGSKPIRIAYVGTLAWHKGVHVLIDALRDLPLDGYELKIFGDPDVFPDYSADLRARAAGLAVRFMGAFDRAQSAAVYRDIDVLAVPSLWLENSPLVIHEAFQAGVPVVCARIGGIAGLVADGLTGILYEPGSMTGLQTALRTLIERPRTVAELAANVNTRTRVKDIADDAREWEQTYAGVLELRMRSAVPAS
jgi:glycosyltransferase involved in cell wall biosynthesis